MPVRTHFVLFLSLLFTETALARFDCFAPFRVLWHSIAGQNPNAFLQGTGVALWKRYQKDPVTKKIAALVSQQAGREYHGELTTYRDDGIEVRLRAYSQTTEGLLSSSREMEVNVLWVGLREDSKGLHVRERPASNDTRFAKICAGLVAGIHEAAMDHPGVDTVRIRINWLANKDLTDLVERMGFQYKLSPGGSDSYEIELKAAEVRALAEKAFPR